MKLILKESKPASQIEKVRQKGRGRYADLVEACRELQLGEAIEVGHPDLTPKSKVAPSTEEHRKFRDRVAAGVRRALCAEGYEFSAHLTKTGCAIIPIAVPKRRSTKKAGRKAR